MHVTNLTRLHPPYFPLICVCGGGERGSLGITPMTFFRGRRLMDQDEGWAGGEGESMSPENF